MPPLAKPQAPDAAIDLAHVVVQQNIGGARRIHAQGGADDAAAGQVRLDDVRLEVFVQKVADAQRPEAQGVEQALLAQFGEGGGQFQQAPQVLGLEGGGVRRRLKQELADQPGLLHHIRLEARMSAGVPRRMASHFPKLTLLVRVVAEVVAVLGEGDAAVVGHHLQAVLRQLQIPGDFRPEQGADIGAVGVGQPG